MLGKLLIGLVSMLLKFKDIIGLIFLEQSISLSTYAQSTRTVNGASYWTGVEKLLKLDGCGKII